MPLKNSERTKKIVAAAGRLFARQGYHGTSTREIARMAEVSENTLFRHFSRKEDLFWTALRSRAEALTPQLDLLNGIRTGDAPAIVLPKILELLADTVNHNPEVLRLIAIAVVELRDKSDAFCRELLSPFVSEVSQYLARSVAKGEVMEVDPSLAAASLVAMVLTHPYLSRMTVDDGRSPIDSQGAVIAYSKFWLDVLKPRIPLSSASISQAVASIS